MMDVYLASDEDLKSLSLETASLDVVDFLNGEDFAADASIEDYFLYDEPEPEQPTAISDASQIDALGKSQPKTDAPLDPKVLELHQAAGEAYIAANKHYQGTKGHVFKYIQINDALRDVSTQYKHYKKFIIHKFFGGPAAPAANMPGSSNHEYGLAIDIIRKGDEARLTKSLESNGWKKHSNPKEPWHFDASGVSEYAAIRAKADAIKSTYSVKIANDLYARLKAEKDFKQAYPAYKTAREALIKRSEELQREQAYLKGRYDYLKRAQANLSADINSFNSEVDRHKALRRRIENFRYRYCPNGKDFNSCSHVNEKNRYLRERNAMVNRYNNWGKDLQRRASSINARKQQLSRDVEKFNIRGKAFQRDVSQFQRDKADLEARARKLQSYIKTIEDFDNTIAGRLSDLNQKVREVRAGSKIDLENIKLSPEEENEELLC